MKKMFTLFVTVAIMAAVTTQSRAATVDDLQKQIDDISGELKALKNESAKDTIIDSKSQPNTMSRILNKTSFGGYGELDYIVRQNNGNGKEGNTFDPHRIVLYVNSELSDWVSFYSELEWEHGGDGKNGKIPLEQAFLDFKIASPFNVKAGLLLVPLGGINADHEPTNFNSTERPDLDRILIPSTWREMGAGIHGALGGKVNYELLVLNGLDGSQFSAENGIRNGRQDMDVDINRNKAVAGRLEVRPLTNLYTNFSFYTGNSAKSGTAYTTIAAFDGKYRISDLELAGEYVHIYQDDPESLGTNPSKGEIGNTMSGYWVEGAYHVMPKSLKKGKLNDADALLFARYSRINLQEGVSNASGKYDREYTTVGLSFKPVPSVAVKADYQFYNDNRAAGEKALDNDKFQITLGFIF